MVPLHIRMLRNPTLRCSHTVTPSGGTGRSRTNTIASHLCSTEDHTLAQSNVRGALSGNLMYEITMIFALGIVRSLQMNCVHSSSESSLPITRCLSKHKKNVPRTQIYKSTKAFAVFLSIMNSHPRLRQLRLYVRRRFIFVSVVGRIRMANRILAFEVRVDP